MLRIRKPHHHGWEEFWGPHPLEMNSSLLLQAMSPTTDRTAIRSGVVKVRTVTRSPLSSLLAGIWVLHTPAQTKSFSPSYACIVPRSASQSKQGQCWIKHFAIAMTVSWCYCPYAPIKQSLIPRDSSVLSLNKNCSSLLSSMISKHLAFSRRSDTRRG